MRLDFKEEGFRVSERLVCRVMA
ncbi:hypothetical protein [Schaalia cardiffensis]